MGTQILDANGQPISTADVKNAGQRQSASIRHLHTDMEAHPASALTPQRIHSILVRAEQGDLVALLDLADDMQERDGQIFSMLQQRTSAVQMMPLQVMPPDNASAAEQRLTERAQELLALANINMPSLLMWSMDAVLKGFAAIEMTWDYRSGALLPKLTQGQQRWFTTGKEEARNTLLLRTDDGAGQALRPLNWIVHQHPSLSGYLSRQALARVLVWPFLFKHYSLRDFAEFLEIYGIPMRLGVYPITASDDDKATLLRAVSEIGHNAAGIIPQGMQIDFKDAASGQQAPFLDMATYMDGVIAKVVVGQTLTSGEGQHGTQALGTVHNEVRLDIAEADARLVSDTLTAQLLRPLLALNERMADGVRLPSLVLDAGRDEDLGSYADNLTKLAGAGMRISVAWAHKKLRIPQASDGEAVLGTAPAPTPVPAPAAPLRAALAAEQGTAAAVPDEIDDLVAEAIGEWQPLMTPMIEPLLNELDAAIERGETLQQLRDRLPELMRLMDERALATAVTRTSFVAATAAHAGQTAFDPWIDTTGS